MRRMSVTSSRCSPAGVPGGKCRSMESATPPKRCSIAPAIWSIRAAGGEDAHHVVRHFVGHRVPAGLPPTCDAASAPDPAARAAPGSAGRSASSHKSRCAAAPFPCPPRRSLRPAPVTTKPPPCTSKCSRDCGRRGACPPSVAAGTPAPDSAASTADAAARRRHLAGDAQHRLADRGDGDRHHRQAGRLRREIRRHQRKFVVAGCRNSASRASPSSATPPATPAHSRASAAPAGSRRCRSGARCGPSPGCPGPARSVRRSWRAGPRPAAPIRSGCAERPPPRTASVPPAASPARAEGKRGVPSRARVPPSSRASKPAASAARAAGPASAPVALRQDGEDAHGQPRARRRSTNARRSWPQKISSPMT